MHTRLAKEASDRELMPKMIVAFEEAEVLSAVIDLEVK
jgi:hypothetical protein